MIVSFTALLITEEDIGGWWEVLLHGLGGMRELS
jgi:hypothetical protein